MDTHVIEEEGHIPIRESSRIDTNFIGNNVYLKKICSPYVKLSKLGLGVST